MKYRFTPLHLPSLYFLLDGIYAMYRDYQSGNNDLGALIPFIFIGIAFLILIIDLAIQAVVRRVVKTDPLKMIYVIEITLIVLALLWVWKTFYPTIIR